MKSLMLDGETIITSILPDSAGYYLTGSRKEDNYNVIVIKLNHALHIEWERTFGNESTDSEGHSGTSAGDGLLVCGCSEGRATDEGGYDWKAHLLRLSGSGDMIWERALRMRGNECAYNVIRGEHITLFGETKDVDGHSGFFLTCLDSGGNSMWNGQYGNYKNIMAGGIVASEGGFIFSGNVKDDESWHCIIQKIGAEGDAEWEKEMPGYFIFQMCEHGDEFIMTGEKSGSVLLAKMDRSGNPVWESTFRKGAGISLLDADGDIMVGGMDANGDSVLIRVDPRGNLVKEFDLGRSGGIEAMAVSDGKLLVAIHSFGPKESTELVMLDL